jgi:hypothetical protein
MKGVRTIEDLTGTVKLVRSVGLPDVGPNHHIGVTHHRFIGQSRFPLVESVVHNFDITQGFLTTFCVK